ncbi:MAG TPA: S41 family peptidase [Vicinamibacterales bacterium]|nr:S41 family peptidase [Vicinamibacterales bacterium]
MRKYRAVSAATFAIFVCALVGGIFGRGVFATENHLPGDYKTFTAALSAIQSQYVGQFQSDRLVYGAIQGMLETLDPHSNFMDPQEYAQMRERQEGHYYGIGVTIQAAGGEIHIVSVFDGSPAFDAGIRRGDVIATVDGQSTKGWTSDQAVDRIKGAKGTSVALGIRRWGYDQLIPFSVAREEIHLSSVPAAFMIDGTTGYVRIAEFAEDTNAQLGRALDALQAKGMRRLIFDLRNNPGGALDQAILVANRFLPKGDLIVYTRGRVPNSDEDYRATKPSQFTTMPMIVLVNRNSASASEIVTGALQDHDRALIVGETTFGKALVQSVYRISGGAGLALTTAHYYTPSGRLIQRPWDPSFDNYLTYTLRSQKNPPKNNPAELHHTDAGRPVYGGGGIEPDRRMDGPFEGFDPTPFGRMLYSRQEFASFAERFSALGDRRVTLKSTGRTLVGRTYVVDDAMLKQFRTQLQRDGIKINEAEYTKDLPFIKAMIHYQIDLALFGTQDAREQLIKTDPQAQFALGLFGEAEQLTQLSKAKAAGRAGNRP